jgi:hypothetical protein
MCRRHGSDAVSVSIVHVVILPSCGVSNTVSANMARSSTRSERIARADKDRETFSIAAKTATADGIGPRIADFGAFHLRYSCVECAVRCTDGGLCGRCKHVRYCSKACQVAGWRRVHKRTCGKFSQWPTIESLGSATMSQVVDVLAEWAPAHLAIVGVALPRLVTEVHTLSRNDAERLVETTCKAVCSLSSSTALDDTIAANWISLAAVVSGAPSYVFDSAIRESGLAAALATLFVGVAPDMLELGLELSDAAVAGRNNRVIEAMIEATANTIFCLDNLPELAASDKFAEAAAAAARVLIAFEHADAFTRRQLKDAPCALLNVIRNTAFRGVAPPPSLLVAAFDAFSRKPGVDNVSLQTWMQTCNNVTGVCGLPCDELQRRLRTAACCLYGAHVRVEFVPLGAQRR